MKIVAISDTHGFHVDGTLPKIPAADILIHAGDCTNRGSITECTGFLEWFHHLDAKHKILVPGNHDWAFDRNQPLMREVVSAYPDIQLLIHQPLELEGLKFFGSPVQPIFFDWAFNHPHNYRKRAWAQIPDDTQVLVTHCPPYRILDTSSWDHRIGCRLLKARLPQLEDLRLHIFGHNHEGYGQLHQQGVQYVNASVCTARYKPVNPPWEINL